MYVGDDDPFSTVDWRPVVDARVAGSTIAQTLMLVDVTEQIFASVRGVYGP